jgi:ABC-type Fe3+ transport system permease subunit
VTLGAMPTDPFHAGDLALGVVALALVLAAAAWLAAPWLVAVTATPEGDPWLWQPRSRGASGVAVWGLVAAIVLLPLVGLAAKAGVEVHQEGNAYVRSWSPMKLAAMVARAPWEHRREWYGSIEIGILAAVATTAVALAAAWLVRGRPRRAVGLAAALALLAAIPAPLWGVWLISLFNQPPDSPLAALTVVYDRTLAAPVLVQTLRALPLVTLWLWAHLATLSPALFDAARCEGAGSWAQFRRIALPLRRPAVAAGLAAALAIAIAELSATLMVLPPGVKMISVAVFQFLHFPSEDRMAALCLSIFVIVGVGVAVAAAWRRRRG